MAVEALISSLATNPQIAGIMGGGQQQKSGSGIDPLKGAAAFMDFADKGVSLADKINNIIMSNKKFKEEKRQFDKKFEEDQRQFGLQYALTDYATRQNISLQKAQQLYNAENLGLSKQAASENIKTSALGRNIQNTEFQWAKQDRSKKEQLAKSLQKGIVMGLMGGKNG